MSRIVKSLIYESFLKQLILKDLNLAVNLMNKYGYSSKRTIRHQITSTSRKQNEDYSDMGTRLKKKQCMNNRPKKKTMRGKLFFLFLFF